MHPIEIIYDGDGGWWNAGFLICARVLKDRPAGQGPVLVVTMFPGKETELSGPAAEAVMARLAEVATTPKDRTAPTESPLRLGGGHMIQAKKPETPSGGGPGEMAPEPSRSPDGIDPVGAPK
jgi:hypothetical protein